MRNNFELKSAYDINSDVTLTPPTLHGSRSPFEKIMLEAEDISMYMATHVILTRTLTINWLATGMYVLTCLLTFSPELGLHPIRSECGPPLLLAIGWWVILNRRKHVRHIVCIHCQRHLCTGLIVPGQSIRTSTTARGISTFYELLSNVEAGQMTSGPIIEQACMSHVYMYFM